jgi:hypothetical protein
VLDQTDLAALVREYGVELRRTGSHWRGTCPFHPDASPSFVVYSRNFHCFGIACGAHGNAIDFATRLCGKPFWPVLKMLAARLGLSVSAASARRTVATTARAPVATPVATMEEDLAGRLRALRRERADLAPLAVRMPAIAEHVWNYLADAAGGEIDLVQDLGELAAARGHR